MIKRLKNGEELKGIFIKQVLPNSPAAKTKCLKTGDKILEVPTESSDTSSVRRNMLQPLCVCVCRSLVLIYKLPATRRRSMPSNQLRVQSSLSSKACQPRHGYTTHTRMCVCVFSHVRLIYNNLSVSTETLQASTRKRLFRMSSERLFNCVCVCVSASVSYSSKL